MQVEEGPIRAEESPLRVDRFYLPTANEVTSVEFAAVAVRKTQHSGILFRDSANLVHLLHLRWFHDLGHSAPTRHDAWAIPDVSSERLRIVAVRCQMVWDKGVAGQKIPYSLRYKPAARFASEDGALSLCDGVTGLTCGTFVLAVFSSCGIELLDIDGWKPRASEQERQNELVAKMEEHREFCLRNPQLNLTPPDEGHLQAMRDEVGCCRFAPNEIAGACLIDAPPASMADCERASRYVDRKLEELELANAKQ